MLLVDIIGARFAVVHMDICVSSRFVVSASAN